MIFICFYKCRLLFQSHYGGHGDCAAHSGEPVEQAGGRLTQPSPPVRDLAAPAPRASTTGLRGWCLFTISVKVAEPYSLYTDLDSAFPKCFEPGFRGFRILELAPQASRGGRCHSARVANIH